MPSAWDPSGVGVASHTGIPHPAGVTPRILLKEEGTASTEPTPSLLHAGAPHCIFPYTRPRDRRVTEAQMNPLQHYLPVFSWRTGGLPSGWYHWGTQALVTDRGPKLWCHLQVGACIAVQISEVVVKGPYASCVCPAFK